jgi:Kdo2-lipid IVA lauroyltransferase/acyltransferase
VAQKIGIKYFGFLEKREKIGLNDRMIELYYRIIKFFLTCLSVIPRTVMSRLAVPVGRLWYQIDRRHRKVATENMKGAFDKEKSESEIAQLVRANFIQLARVALEIPSLLKFRTENAADYVTLSGQEHIEEAKSRKKGILCLTAHLGNWELMAIAAPIVAKLPLGVVARTLDFKPLDRLLTEIRTRTGNQVINKKKGGDLIGRMLKEGEAVGILLDQNTSYIEGVYVPFFGITACTNKGLAMFALRYHATVLPAFNIREKDGRYRIIIGEPIQLIKTGNIRKDILLNTQLFNAIMERYIRMAPDNWLWVHRRWLLKRIPASMQDHAGQLSLDPLPKDVWIPGI